MGIVKRAYRTVVWVVWGNAVAEMIWFVWSIWSVYYLLQPPVVETEWAVVMTITALFWGAVLARRIK